MENKKVAVGIIGASGFGGFELVKILRSHRHARIARLATRSRVDEPYSAIWPSLSRVVDLESSPIDVDAICKECDLLFFSLPNNISFSYAPLFIERGKKVIDLSGSYRIKDPEIYRSAYGQEHGDPSRLSSFTYGLPELYSSEIKGASCIANPGCFPTTVLLALYPLLKAGCIDLKSLIIDSKSGISGAGKAVRQELHFIECHENMRPYKVGLHQHIPEIEQEIFHASGRSASILFTPHLVPINRGILSTIYCSPTEKISDEELKKLYREFSKKCYFVRFLESRLPEISAVASTNFCDLSFKIVRDKLILFSAIDNLIKGAAGQAVQNMNLMYGFKECEGLV